VCGIEMVRGGVVTKVVLNVLDMEHVLFWI
jgi:hypothetical protein